MLKKIGFAYLVLLAANLCTLLLYGCRCETDPPRYCVRLQSVGVSLKDNGGLDPQPVFNQTVYAKALILSLSFNEIRYQCLRKTFPMLNAAYAMCKKPQDEIGYNANEVFISLDRDYDRDHPAGTDLKDLFLQRGNEYYLMSAPDDTSGMYRFAVQLAYQKLQPPLENDTMTVFATPLKLKK